MPDIGHNQGPPLDLVETTLAPLISYASPTVRKRIADLVAVANKWKATVKEITHPDTAAACEDLLTQLRQEYDAVDTARAEAKRPHDLEAKRVQDAFRPALDLLGACSAALKPLKTGWLLREQKRIEDEKRLKAEKARKAEEDARRAAELAAAPDAAIEDALAAQNAAADAQTAAQEAEAAASAKAQVRGGFSARASGLRSHWHCAIVDWPAAAAAMAADAGVKEAVQRACNRKASAEKAGMDVAWGRAVETKGV